MKYLVLIVWVLLSSCVFVPPNFQQASNLCSSIVDSALKVTDQLCTATSVDQACYGHVHLDAEPQPGFGPLQFNQAGDKIDVTGLRSLRVSAMNSTTGDWGVALFHVQANLPNAAPGQNVTLLVLGDVQLENKVEGRIPVPVTVTARENVNIRQSPSLDSYVAGTLHPGQIITARGRLKDSSWLYVDLPDATDVGWVYAPSVSSTTGIQTLAVVNPDSAYFAPMQAFYIQTGNDNLNCAEAPENGLVIQTSEGVAEVNLWINEVRIRLGSTAFIQAQRNKQMTITMLEGESHVQAKGVEYAAPAGTQLTIPMDQNLAPAAPPNPPAPITDTNISNLPVQNLDRPITIPTLLPSPTLTVTSSTLTPVSTDTEVLTPTFTLTDMNTLIPSDTPTDIPTPTQTNTDVPGDTPTAAQTELVEPTQTNTDLPSDTPIPPDTPTWTDVPPPTPSDTPADFSLVSTDPVP